MKKRSAVRLIPLAVAAALVIPAVIARLSGAEPSPMLAVLLYAAAFIGAALLLAWGTELAQADLPRGLAVSLLAFIAILPEYAVDLLFAYKAGRDPTNAPLALANMTGANRLLIGLGWSLVVIMGAIGARRGRSKRARSVTTSFGSRYALALTRRSAVDVFVLACVSLYTLSFIFRQSLTLVDAAILFGAFAFYVYRLWTAPKEEPELIGPPAVIDELPKAWRRAATIGLMLIAAGVIFLAAEPFSQALIAGGKALGISDFLMVQWIAPFATETAELIPACIFAYRQSSDEGLGTLLSSKINQWTLLVGGVPIAYAISRGALDGLPIDPMQRQELFLTAAQSVFAITLLADDLRLGVREAGVIFALFTADLVTSIVLDPPQRPWARFAFSGLYLALSVATTIRARRHLRELSRNAVLVPIDKLPDTPHDPTDTDSIDTRGT